MEPVTAGRRSRRGLQAALGPRGPRRPHFPGPGGRLPGLGRLAGGQSWGWARAPASRLQRRPPPGDAQQQHGERHAGPTGRRDPRPAPPGAPALAPNPPARRRLEAPSLRAPLRAPLLRLQPRGPATPEDTVSPRRSGPRRAEGGAGTGGGRGGPASARLFEGRRYLLPGGAGRWR